MSEFVEFPKWLHAKGRKSVLADDAEAESAQLAVWFEADAAKLASAGNVLVFAQAPAPAIATDVAPKAKGGWPKGKPRAKKAV